MRNLGPLVATHVFVAAAAWTNGYLIGTFLQRRHRLELEAWVALSPVSFVDLADPPALYDWAAEGVFEWPGGVTVHGPYPPNRETR